MPHFKTTITCEAGHTQVFTLRGVDRLFAEEHAKLLDGTSLLYVVDPRQGEHASAWIGHCQVGVPVAADVLPGEPEEFRGTTWQTHKVGDIHYKPCGALFKCAVEEVPEFPEAEEHERLA